MLFGSRARDDITRIQRGEKIKNVHSAGVAVVALGFEASPSTSNFARGAGSRLEIGRDCSRRSRRSRRAKGDPLGRRTKRSLSLRILSHAAN